MESIITDKTLFEYTQKLCKTYAEKLYNLCYDADDLMQECSIIYLSTKDEKLYKKTIKEMMNELVEINNKEK